MLELLLLAFFLGFKHSYDADHLVAVAAFIPKAKTFRESVGMGVAWAVGHMLTATIITVLIFMFKDAVISFFDKFEIIVAVMLIVLGVISLRQAKIFHLHRHTHAKEHKKHEHIHLKKEHNQHAHKHMFGIGIIHGLASNDELLTLITITLGISTLAGMIAGVAVFSIGVVAGMVVFSLVLSYPLLKSRQEEIVKWVHIIVGIASIVYGSYMLAGIFQVI